MQQKSKLRQFPMNEHLITETENWQNWRLKSLNSGNLQRYSLPFASKSSSGQLPKEPQQGVKHIPKITKINEYIFAIMLNNLMNLFYYIDESERQKRKTKSRFIKLTIQNIVLPAEVQCVFGDGKEAIYLASSREVLVVRVRGQGGKGVQQVTEIFRKKINNIKGMKMLESNYRKNLLILTNQTVYFHDVNKNYEVIRELPIAFSAESSGWSDISKINGISIVLESPNVFYFVGTSVELKADVRFKLAREEVKNEPVEKKCEALYLTKFQLTKTKAQARVFIIDHIFEIGIFKKSRVHQVGSQTFLLSLYEEIIVIRRNFSKFMVWDNVSIVSSKSNEKKGQLILADKRIMVYTESGEISAYELFFNFEKAKLETPKIDSFKGNGNEEQILYDALILEYKSQTYMKVLFYFKQMEIYIPNRKAVGASQESAYTTTKNELFFQIMCIEQTEPTEKLKQLLEKNKSQHQIESFLKRFNIKELKYKKSEWEVSAKGQKEIETFLLNIKDNEYIQSQLTKILKSKPHDLAFLIAVEKKQIERYRNMVASKLLLFEELQENFQKNKSKQDNLVINKLSEYFLMRELDEVKLAIQWLLESKMFYKKLLYSMNFMTFKEYDFIQIGKLKTASLREEIKLLGVKGYEKRLKYFLNSFKYLVLDDFKLILRFVISDLNEHELKVFFYKNFPFILPSYVPTSSEDRCRLWDNTFNQDELQIETISLFRKEVEEEMTKLAATVPQMFLRIPLKQAVVAFNDLFNQFMASPWFIENSYKQHSLLHHSIDELKNSFEELKEVGVFNTIIELAYEKIESKAFDEGKVKDVINGLKKQNYLKQDYIYNIEARLEVYELMVLKVKIDKKRYLGFVLPKKSQFIIMKQSDLFSLLFDNFPEHLPNIIKDIYDTKRQNLFLSNFKKYLYSPLPQLESLIKFMEHFRGQEHSDVSKQVFDCICKMMPITDGKNSLDLINRIKDMPVPHHKDKEKFQAHLLDSTKVSYGNCFSPLFIKFELNYTYAELIAQTECPKLKETKIMWQIISKFIKEYNPHLQNIIEFKKSQLIDEQISSIYLNEMIDLLSITLYLHQMLDYKFDRSEILASLIIGFFNSSRYENIGQLMEEILEFGKVFDDRKLIESYGNYRVFNQWKIETNVKKELENTALEWIDERYQWLIGLQSGSKGSGEGLTDEVLKAAFVAISSVLKILNFYSSGEKIECQISRIALLSTIKQVSPKILILLLPSLIHQSQKYQKISSFIFMMNLLTKLSSPENRQIFNLRRREQILELLSGLNKICREFVNVFHREKKSQDVLLGELCRFNAELVVELMGWGFPRVAGFVLLDLINSSYHYRDVLFYYVARMADRSKVGEKTVEKLVYEFMTIDSPHDLKKILNTYIVQYQLAEPAPAQHLPSTILFIFTQIIKNNQLDEAFYFALRNIEVEVEQFEAIVLATQKFRQDHVFVQSLLVTFIRTVKMGVQGQIWPTFMLFKRKINCLMRPNERMDVIKDIVIMMRQLEIQELKQRLKSTGRQLVDTSKPSPFEKLTKQYQKYMQLQNLNPYLTINTEQIQPSAIRLQKYPQYSIDQIKSKQQYYKLLPILREEQSNQVKELRRKLFDNEQKLKQIQESNRQLLEEQIVPAITQVRINAEREHLSLIERRRKKMEIQEEEASKMREKAEAEKKEEELASDSEFGQKESLMKLDQEEKDKIKQAKKTFTSKIVQETQNLISQLRERRKKVKEETAVTFATEDDRKKTEENQSFISGKSGGIARQYPKKQDMINSMAVFNSKANQNQNEISNSGHQSPGKNRKSKVYENDAKKSIIAARDELKEKLEFLRESHLKGTTMNRLMADKSGEFYVPRWEQKNPMRLQFEEMLQDKPKKSSQFVEKVKKEMNEEAEKEKKEKAEKEKAKKVTLPDLMQKYKLLNQPAASEMVQKIAVVANNPRAGTELIRNIYTQMKDIKNFLELCRDLLLLNESTRDFIQQKAIKIVEESLKTKVVMAYKEIFPAQFFTSVHSVSVRDYYSIAYGMIQPNLLKLMGQPGYNVNALAIMIRFGFGSDSSFYYRIYEDYIRSLLQSYQSKPDLLVPEKDLMQLCQKLRTNYNNLNPASKRATFEQLVKEIKLPEKRKALVKASLLNLENKSSMVNKESYEEFRLVLVKLEDGL